MINQATEFYQGVTGSNDVGIGTLITNPNENESHCHGEKSQKIQLIFECLSAFFYCFSYHKNEKKIRRIERDFKVNLVMLSCIESLVNRATNR